MVSNSGVKDFDGVKEMNFYRENTKIQLRKAKAKTELSKRKLMSSKPEDTLTLDSIDLNDSSILKGMSTFKEYLQYVVFSNDSDNLNTFKHAVYSLRVFLTSDKAPTQSSDYEDHINIIYTLINILEKHCSNLQLAHELLWILSSILFYISNSTYSELIFNNKLLTLMYNIITDKKATYGIKITVMYVIGNALISSPNRTTLISSQIFDYIIQVLNTDSKIEEDELFYYLWILSRIASITPCLSIDSVSNNINFRT